MKRDITMNTKLIFRSIIPFCSNSYASYHILWLQFDTLLGFKKKSQKSSFFSFYKIIGYLIKFHEICPQNQFFWKKSIFLKQKVAQVLPNTFVYSRFNFGRYIFDRSRCAAIFFVMCRFKIYLSPFSKQKCKNVYCDTQYH